MTTSPIADLSYRGYDGPLVPPQYRWWVIAKMMMRLSIKKKGFWIWSALSSYWYLITGAVFYFMEVISQRAVSGGAQGQNPTEQLLKSVIWKDQFLLSFGFSQLMLFLVALLIGAGSIAADNKANALLVYLSKPCTKRDYLLGKWVAVALMITAVVSVPMLIFYFYCFFSYQQYGFFSQDPWLLLKLIALMPIPGILHASVVMGVSSLFDQGRMAGAVYAGIYFMLYFMTVMIGAIRGVVFGNTGESPVLNNLFYASIDGLNQGLAKIILGTRGSVPFSFAGANGPPPPPAPTAFVIFPAFVAVCAIFLWVAWTRIRAVEVVGS